MGLKYLLPIAFIFLLTACNGATITPAATPSPAPTPTSAFESSKFGTVASDVAYCTMNNLPQKMDVYYPSSGGPWPALVYIHGGSWVEGDKADGSGWRYLNDQGYLVVSVNYRLTTYQIKFPAMIEDVKCAVRYLRAHAAELNIDPDRIGALGASAGGHLAALLGLTNPAAGWDVGEYLGQSSRVQAVITLAAPADFTRAFPESLTLAIYSAFDDLPGENSSLMVAASPVTYVSPEDPPFLIFHGDKDGVVPVEQGQALLTRLEAAGIPAQLVIVQGGDHSLKGANATPSEQEISELILEFLEKSLPSQER